MDLRSLKVGEPERFVAALEEKLRASGTLAEACTTLCRSLHARCTAGTERTLVLSRLYFSVPYELLDTGAQAFARLRLGREARPAEFFLALLGTYGDLRGWRDRSRSRGHRALPLNRQTVTSAPMLARSFQQIGFDLDLVLSPSEDIHLEGIVRGFGLFHVEDAAGAPSCPPRRTSCCPTGWPRCWAAAPCSPTAPWPSGSVSPGTSSSKTPPCR